MSWFKKKRLGDDSLYDDSKFNEQSKELNQQIDKESKVDLKDSVEEQLEDKSTDQLFQEERIIVEQLEQSFSKSKKKTKELENYEEPRASASLSDIFGVWNFSKIIFALIPLFVIIIVGSATIDLMKENAVVIQDQTTTSSSFNQTIVPSAINGDIASFVVIFGILAGLSLMVGLLSKFFYD